MEAPGEALSVAIDAQQVKIETDRVRAAVNRQGYTSGVAAGSFVDKASGARDLGFGLAIADFLLRPGWGPAQGALSYSRDRAVHGNLPKQYVELPQICTQARVLPCRVTPGADFVAVQQWFQWTEAAEGFQPGSRWEQTLVFPQGRRYFFAADRITSANDVEGLIFRLDLPGHLKHNQGDNFSAVYLSYHGAIPAESFRSDFPPDARYLYQRGDEPPEYMIRAYHTRIDGEAGPWLAGITLEPAVVSEAWCHQRGYVCFIQEIGGFDVKAGQSFGAAYIIGWFDDVAEMEQVACEFRGITGIEIEGETYRLVGGDQPSE